MAGGSLGVFGTFWHLFSPAKFGVHRKFGIVYLALFAAAVIFEITGRYARLLWVVMPLAGITQSIIACRTFTFLPAANEKMQGYYHETRVMSYDFIVENIYFAGLLLFQSCYLTFSAEMRANPIYLPLELLGVFFPYYTVRNFFPKSSFRHSTKEGNKYAEFVKVFYVIAKHFSGYYVNYLNFLGKFGPTPVKDYYLIRYLFILGGWGTTIAMFLQTLKFKKYIGMTTAMILYAGSFPFFYMCYVALFYVAMEHMWLTGLTAVGVAVNFGPRWGQIAYQVFMCGVCLATRFELV